MSAIFIGRSRNAEISSNTAARGRMTKTVVAVEFIEAAMRELQTFPDGVTSHCVGLTFPGMIDEPGSFSGITSSAKPARGPHDSCRIWVAIL